MLTFNEQSAGAEPSRRSVAGWILHALTDPGLSRVQRVAIRLPLAFGLVAAAAVGVSKAESLVAEHNLGCATANVPQDHGSYVDAARAVVVPLHLNPRSLGVRDALTTAGQRLADQQAAFGHLAQPGEPVQTCVTSSILAGYNASSVRQ